jgi:hypothetical protein
MIGIFGDDKKIAAAITSPLRSNTDKEKRFTVLVGCWV